MKQAIMSWLLIIVAVALAASANTVAALWGQNRSAIYLIFLLLLSPLVFISFGLVTSARGLSVSSGVIDSLLVLTTVSIGLFFFDECSKELL